LNEAKMNNVMGDFPLLIKGRLLDDMVFNQFGDARCIGGTKNTLGGLNRSGSTFANVTEGMETLSAKPAIFDGPKPPKPAPRMGI
jgi:hypothetical protein